MTDYAAVSRQLQDALHLSLAPIAIRFADDVPRGVPAFADTVAAGCVFWERAACETFATAANDHALCAIGIHTHHLRGAPEGYEGELKTVLKVMSDVSYVRDEDVARIPVLDREVTHVIYGPLAEATEAPDVVMLFADSRDGLVVTEAVDQIEGASPPALGRPACALVPQVANTKRAAASLGCCGARAYVDALSPAVALWGLPGDAVARYAERIAKLAAANETLGKFHELRRADVAAGAKPSVDQSLARLS